MLITKYLRFSYLQIVVDKELTLTLCSTLYPVVCNVSSNFQRKSNCEKVQSESENDRQQEKKDLSNLWRFLAWI